MPLYDLGYRAWNGVRLPRWSLWYVVTSTGFQLAWKSRWLRRLLFVAWLPALYLGLGIFFFEKAVEYPEWRAEARGFVRSIPGAGPTAQLLGNSAEAFAEQLPNSRYKVWSAILLTLFRYPQGLVMVLVVGLIAPPLISSDLRSRAYLLYFSRPLSVTEYLFGKSATIWGYLFAIVVLPALTLYVLGVLLSSDISVFRYTWDLPLRVLVGYAVMAVPTTMLALAISSIFHDNRYAVATWFALWMLGAVVYTNLASVKTLQGQSIQGSWWSALSLYHLIGSVQNWIFGFGQASESMIAGELTILIIITLISMIILYHRVSAPIRA